MKTDKEVLSEVFDILHSSSELNMNNYSEGEVEELNGAVIRAYNILREHGEQHIR